MAGASLREQAFGLLSAANNHGDLAVKLSSLKQAKHVLLSLDAASAGELLPFLADLHSSPECLVRQLLVEIMEDIALREMKHSSVFMPALLALLKDGNYNVARQSVFCGTKLFCCILEAMALQFHQHGKVERWLEELWMWMVKFKDVVFSIAFEPGSVGMRLLALKFLETYVLLFTSDTSDFETSKKEGRRRSFNILWLGGHPILDPVLLFSEANRTLDIFLDLLRSASSLPGTLTIVTVNCLAAIARKRPVHYSTILSSLLDFDPNFETTKGCHSVSIQYSLRTAFLGFLRCTYPPIIESRDKLLRTLRALNAGDAADQAIRQVDKLIKNTERVLRDPRLGKDDQLSNQLSFLGDSSKKRSMPQDKEEPTSTYEMASKRVRYGSDTHFSSSTQISDSGHDFVSLSGVPQNVPQLDSVLTPEEQMIAMIGALLAEGERGAESLEILISQLHPDLLADIIITNMKHLPKVPPPSRLGNGPAVQQIGFVNSPAQVVAPSAQVVPLESPVLPGQLPFPSTTITSTSPIDVLTIHNSADSKRDPRRDPRRLDPRRVSSPIGVPSVPVVEETSDMPSEFDSSLLSSKLVSRCDLPNTENPLASLSSKIKIEDKSLEIPLHHRADDKLTTKEEVPDLPENKISEVNAISDLPLSSFGRVDEDSVATKWSDVSATTTFDRPSFLESDQYSPSASNASSSEETCQDLPVLPLYVHLSEEQQRSVKKLAIERIIMSYKNLSGPDASLTRMEIIARLVAQIDGDDMVTMLQKYIFVDYQQQKGHELVLHVLYHMHSLMIMDSVQNSSFAAAYEKLLLSVVHALLDVFPASDKSFSKLLGEVPFLPDSALKILDELCYANVVDENGKVVRDAERVTQGLGAVWSLLLGRPCNRQAFLHIALKCAVHSQDEIRAKAIRLVANKLFKLTSVTENIEQFATDMFLSAVDHSSDVELSQGGTTEQKPEGEVESQETFHSCSQVSESATSETDATKDEEQVVQGVSTSSASDAQRLVSLYFALCTKKPSLLQLIFDAYGRAPKLVKQAVHRHIPILIRALGSSSSELLRVVSDPPHGSENLLMMVIQILTEVATPSPDLISAVKHLYETKLKDATVLIPMLSSLSKTEVLPIFPRLIDLPLEKFQAALAHILQGSAHTGPALTPAEVLVAIHDIRPEKDRVALKKITDACSACFEQRTVFTQQVLAKALNQMVDQTPLPLLFMRTIIQAIDAFPTLVGFVMEILSKLVTKQVWRMPKLWVGFMKCVSQTQPHSFQVLLQLPPPQLEGALNKHANLRGPLGTYASQPSVRASLPRSILAVLGIANELNMQQPHLSASLHNSDASSSVQGATLM